jgi:hypothetical protein
VTACSCFCSGFISGAWALLRGPRRISSGGICAGEGKHLGGRLSLRYVLAAYSLAFDNARVESQTINTGRRRRRFSRLSGLISRLPCLGVLPDFHASIVRLTFETRKPMISATPRTDAKLTLCETMKGNGPYIPVGIANDLWIALLLNFGRHFFTTSVSG